MRRNHLILVFLAAALLGRAGAAELLNASYDPTREFYAEYNPAFAAYWKGKTGETVSIKQSHGGSGSQARAVIDGLDADVVTLALAADIDGIHTKAQLLPANWQQSFPDHSTPYTSTIVLLVRRGNPRQIKDWDDLIKPGIKVVTANPKTSGGARWAYLAAWGYAQLKAGNNPAAGKDFVSKLYSHVPVLDSGARGSTVTFVQRKIGDVLISWENEGFLAQKEFVDQGLEMIVPSASILAEPPVAVVDKVVDKHGTRKVAEEYLKYLYSPEGQEIAGRNFYRPRNSEALEKYAKNFAKIKLFTIDDRFGGWTKAQKTHFAEGGVFDQIYKP